MLGEEEEDILSPPRSAGLSSQLRSTIGWVSPLATELRQPVIMEAEELVDYDSEPPAPEIPAPVVHRSKRAKTVLSTPARKSARLQGSMAIPATEKAELRAAAKNLDPTGTSISDFTALDKHSDDHLLRVASDSGLAFESEAGDPLTILSLVRAKENAQAALAHATFLMEVAAKKASEATGPPIETVGAVNVNPDLGSSLAPLKANKRGARVSKLATRSGRGRKSKA